ncbi:MAG: Ig-like domain-containing protein [Candidatus Bathyarchaeia archaeon]
MPFAHYRELIHSYPSLESSSNLFPMGIFGPAPNSTGVPLDTAIVIALTRPVNIENFSLAPQGPAITQTVEHSPPASETYTFYFAEPLEPATPYTVSALSGGEPVSWNFTTTTVPYEPQYNTYLYPYVPWVALGVAVLVTFSVCLIIWQKNSGGLRVC